MKKKILVKPLIRRFGRAALRQDQAKRRREDEAIPRVALTKKHVSNCQMLLNRMELLDRLPKNGAVTELGVDEGEFSQAILRVNHPRVLHLVDPWGKLRYHDGKHRDVITRFEQEIGSGRVVIHRKRSVAAVEDFENQSLDWVYIDTRHSYEATRNELLAYASKVKPGGFIAGHDYSMGNWIKQRRYGVIESVHEFCVTHDWEIVFLTIDPIERPSFAIRELGRTL